LNRAFIISAVVILVLSQLSYLCNHVSNVMDMEAGVKLIEPIGYSNPYHGLSKTIRALVEVVFASLLFLFVYKTRLNNYSAAVSIFLLFSTLNQFVDRFFNPYAFGINELVFLILAVITSTWIATIWKTHIPTFGKESEKP
jgi:hypothetical protein